MGSKAGESQYMRLYLIHRAETTLALGLGLEYEWIYPRDLSRFSLVI